MKSKKKLLLMGVGVMGALAMGVGATSTFAWYQVTTTGVIKTSDNSAEITTVKPVGGVEVNLPVKVSLSDNLSSKQLELAHYYAAYSDGTEDSIGAANSWYKGTPSSYTKQTSANTAGLFTAVHLSNAAADLVYNDEPMGGTTNYALSTIVTVTITKPDSNYIDESTGTVYTPADVANMLNGKKADIKLERAADRYVASTDTAVVTGKTYYTLSADVYTSVASPTGNPSTSSYYEKLSSRAMFFSLGTSASIAVSSAATAQNGINDTTTQYTLSDLGGSGTKIYFGLFVDGNNGVNVDKTLVSGDYKVTVSQHSA